MGTLREDADDAPSLAVRLWRSGRLPVALAAGLFALSTVVPLLRDVHLAGGAVSVTLLDLARDRYPVVGHFAAWLVTGAAAFHVSLLYSRRSGSAMAASRPMVLVVSLAPLVGAVLPFLRLRRYGQEAGVGPAAALVVAGVVLGVLGALRFGEGVADPQRRGAHDDED